MGLSWLVVLAGELAGIFVLLIEFLLVAVVMGGAELFVEIDAAGLTGYRAGVCGDVRAGEKVLLGRSRRVVRLSPPAGFERPLRIAVGRRLGAFGE